jgi:cytochrome P450
MLAAEGQVHKRQRRVATPAFSVQNMRALVPLVFGKGAELRDRWMDMIIQGESGKEDELPSKTTFDVCHWISRATFDVIGLAGQLTGFAAFDSPDILHLGFDYNFNAIQDETNELFVAYKEMFEVAISQGSIGRTVFNIYLPYLSALFVSAPVDSIFAFLK